MSKRKLSELTLDKKMELLHELEKNPMSLRAAELKYGVPRCTLSRILRNKDKLEKAWSENYSSKRKRVGKLMYAELDAKVYDFFVSMRSKNVRVSGPMLKNEARNVATALGLDGFSGSNGWLESFCERHSIQFKGLCGGESANVDLSVAADFCETLHHFVEGYGSEDVLNADETGLQLYRQFPTKSLDVVISDESDADKQIDKPPSPHLSKAEADDCLRKLIQFARMQYSTTIVNDLLTIEEKMRREWSQEKKHQTSITDFFFARIK